MLDDRISESLATTVLQIAQYTKAFVTTPFAVLNNINTDKKLEAISSARNILTHRVDPPRQFILDAGAGEYTAKIARLDLTLDKDTTRSRQTEIARLLSSGLAGLRVFVNTKL
jgi:hypothetical protein